MAVVGRGIVVGQYVVLHTANGTCMDVLDGGFHSRGGGGGALEYGGVEVGWHYVQWVAVDMVGSWGRDSCC
jgi:hypothetical protein